MESRSGIEQTIVEMRAAEFDALFPHQKRSRTAQIVAFVGGLGVLTLVYGGISSFGGLSEVPLWFLGVLVLVSLVFVSVGIKYESKSSGVRQPFWPAKEHRPLVFRATAPVLLIAPLVAVLGAMAERQRPAWQIAVVGGVSLVVMIGISRWWFDRLRSRYATAPAGYNE